MGIGEICFETVTIFKASLFNTKFNPALSTDFKERAGFDILLVFNRI